MYYLYLMRFREMECFSKFWLDFASAKTSLSSQSYALVHKDEKTVECPEILYLIRKYTTILTHLRSIYKYSK